MNHPVKKEQHQCNFPDCRCILHPERLDCWSKTLHKCNHPKKPEYTSPRPDGWEEILDDLDMKLEYLFNLGGWALIAYVEKNITKEEREALLNDWNIQGRIYMREALLSQHHKDIEAFRGMIEGMRRTPMFEPKQTALAIIYNEAIDDVLTALSTFASTDTGKENL